MSEPNPPSTSTEPSAQNKKAAQNVKESLIQTVNSREEFEEILRTMKDKYVIVEFYASWCGPCKSLAMQFQQLAEKYGDNLKVLKIDIEELEELAIEYEVKAMPAFMIMKNSKKLQQYSGSKTEQVDEMVKTYLEQKS